MDRVFDTGKDYDVPLLRLLCRLPGGQGETAEVCKRFEAEYRSLIPADHRGLRSTGDPIWYNNVCWSRNNLRKSGFLAESKRGVWQVNEKGRRWLEQNPHATNLEGVPEEAAPQRRRKSTARSAPMVPGLTLEVLEQTRKLIPADQFRQLWGALYDQLVAEERAQATTAITQTELGRRARQRLDEVHAFLQGKNLVAPSGDVLCDWIHFCYALDLYREAAALLPFVQEASVDPAIYRRAKRVAEVCRNKLAS